MLRVVLGILFGRILLGLVGHLAGLVGSGIGGVGGSAAGVGGQVNVVELYISYLRKKIDSGRPALIRTVRGAGYIMREPR